MGNRRRRLHARGERIAWQKNRAGVRRPRYADRKGNFARRGSHRDPLDERETVRRARFEILGQPGCSERPVRCAGNCDGERARRASGQPDRGVRASSSGDRASGADRRGNSSMQAVDADRLDARETECQACTRPTAARATTRESVNTTNSSRAQTCEESVACKLEARATVHRERGRDGPISWGTARWASSRRQTHRVGNQAVGACDTNSCAWRNHVMRASWDADRRSGNRTASVSKTKSSFGQPKGDKVVRTKSPCRYSSTRDDVRRDARGDSGNWIDAGSGSKARRVGNCAHE